MGSLTDYRTNYQIFWSEMVPFVADVVEKSFITEGMRNPTFSEVKRRTDMLKSIVDQLKHEFGWSKQRIRDNMALIFRCKLIGLDLDIDAMNKRGSW